MFNDCKKVLFQKGREYQNTVDDGINVFENFETTAAELDITREDVLWIFFTKHRNSISKFIKDLKTKEISQIEENISEPINGRILDAINYLLLLNAMVVDLRNRTKFK
jgi:hypothetical protein